MPNEKPLKMVLIDRTPMRLRRVPCLFSSDDRLHDFAVNVGQPVVASAVSVREFRVVDSHLVQDGGVQVVDRLGVDDGRVPELVGFAEGDTAFEPPPG